MNGSRHEAITHVLALIAVAVILILAAAVVASSVSKPSRNSQTAAVNSAGVPIPTPNPLIKPLTEEERKTAIEKKCEELKPKGLTPDLKQEFTGNTTEDHMCVAVIHEFGTPKCVGKQSEVIWDFKGKGTIVSRAAPDLPMGICKTKFCDITGKCGPERSLAAGQTVTEWAEDPGIFSNLKPAEQQLISAGLDKASADILNRSLTAEAKDLDYQIADAIKARDDVQQALSRYAQGCVSLECRDERNAVAADLESKQQAVAALEEQKDRLAFAATRITGTPPDNNDDTGGGPGTRDDIFSGLGGFGPGGLGGGGGAGGIGQLLQGLMKGMQGQGGQQGGAPPPGNQNPQTPGTCAPQLVCTNNTLYSRNSQCVDVPMQQCPHGCTGN